MSLTGERLLAWARSLLVLVAFQLLLFQIWDALGVILRGLASRQPQSDPEPALELIRTGQL